jgi:uncharacterized integral membrane protein
VGLSYLLVAVVAVAVTLFALQNSTEITLRFAVWEVAQVPLATIVLVALGVGLLVAGLPLWVRLGIWRRRAHGLEARVRTLEAAATERDRPRSQPPGPQPL